jgi:hypothetical protein
MEMWSGLGEKIEELTEIIGRKPIDQNILCSLTRSNH